MSIIKAICVLWTGDVKKSNCRFYLNIILASECMYVRFFLLLVYFNRAVIFFFSFFFFFSIRNINIIRARAHIRTQARTLIRLQIENHIHSK